MGPWVSAESVKEQVRDVPGSRANDDDAAIIPCVADGKSIKKIILKVQDYEKSLLTDVLPSWFFFST